MTRYFADAGQSMNLARARFRSFHPKQDMATMVRSIVDVPPECFARGWNGAIRAGRNPRSVGLVIVSMFEELLRYGVGYGVPKEEVLRRIAEGIAIVYPMLNGSGSGSFLGVEIEDSDPTSMPRFALMFARRSVGFEFSSNSWLIADIGDQVNITRARYHLVSPTDKSPKGLPVGATVESEIDRLGDALREISKL